MISLVRIHLVLFSISTVALGTERNDTGTQLTFEISPIHLAVPHPLQAKPQDRRPSYAAGITTQGSTDFFPSPRSNRVDDFLSFARQQGLSLPQREFLEDTNGLLDSTERSVTFYYPMDDPNHPQLLLYAMSLADAKRMAELYLQFARRDFTEFRDEAERTVQDMSERAAKAEKRIPELEKSLEAMQKSFEQTKSVIPYRSEQEALEAIGDLNRMLNTAQVEISGTRAKIEAIQGYQQPHQGDAILSPKLEIMFIEEAVAMRGAAARKQTATELRTQSSQFIDLKQTIKNATEEKDELTRDLPVWREHLAWRQKELAARRDREPRIRDNKVVIYPVR